MLLSVTSRTISVIHQNNKCSRRNQLTNKYEAKFQNIHKTLRSCRIFLYSMTSKIMLALIKHEEKKRICCSPHTLTGGVYH